MIAMPHEISVGEELPPMGGPKPATPNNDRQRRQAKKDPKGKQRPTRAKAVGERFRTLNAFVDLTLARLGRAEIAVWLVLFRDCRDGLVRTGQTDIARRSGMNRRTVYRSLRQLEQRGLLRVVRKGRLGAGPSVYRLHWLSTDE